MIRKRQPHRKSRMGCLECKRRQVKCDELKPTCTRCKLTLHKCRYPPAVFSVVNKPKDKPSTLSPPLCSILPSSPDSPCSISLPLSERSTPPVSEMVETTTCSHDPEAIIYPSDDHLYRHYLDHTSMTLTHCDSDCAVMQIGIPVLAKKSRPVFHALLALSAACLCCDMIYKKPVPSLDYVNEVLMTGYQHYNLASEQMRELISQPDASNTDPLLASTVLLVPFAAAIQQVNHWISKRIRTPESKPLSTTPRDVIVMMRGIRSTLQTLSCDTLTIEKTGYATNISVAPWLEYDMLAAPHMSSTHVMFSIIAATSQGAFAKLRVRLESCHSDVQSSDDQLYACMEAFELLVKIRTATFSSSNLARPNKKEAEFEQSDGFESVSMSQLRSWLRFYAHRTKNPLPTEPLTRSFLDFLVQAPQAYLDLVLPLLDQRLENPRYIMNEDTDELTRKQALALDIYAHWSVFMFLVEDESWWIGNLPIVTLTGMVNRYGGRFVTRLWPQVNDGPEQWWPGSMLAILREIHQCR